MPCQPRSLDQLLLVAFNVPAWHIASLNLPQLNKRNSVVIFSANHQLVLTCIRVLLPLFLPAGRRPPER